MRLVEPDAAAIVHEVTQLLTNRAAYDRMAVAASHTATGAWASESSLACAASSPDAEGHDRAFRSAAGANHSSILGLVLVFRAAAQSAKLQRVVALGSGRQRPESACVRSQIALPARSDARGARGLGYDPSRRIPWELNRCSDQPGAMTSACHGCLIGIKNARNLRR